VPDAGADILCGGQREESRVNQEQDLPTAQKEDAREARGGSSDGKGEEERVDAQQLGLSTVTVYGYDRKHYGWYTGTVPPYPSP
jgi:hypothetical protein